MRLSGTRLISAITLGMLRSMVISLKFLVPQDIRRLSFKSELKLSDNPLLVSGLQHSAISI